MDKTYNQSLGRMNRGRMNAQRGIRIYNLIEDDLLLTKMAFKQCSITDMIFAINRKKNHTKYPRKLKKKLKKLNPDWQAFINCNMVIKVTKNRRGK